MQLDILVVGGGLGGLTTALALRRAGHHVKVIEATSWLREVGAAITVPPNACRALRGLGVDLADAKVVEFRKGLHYQYTDQPARYGEGGTGVSSSRERKAQEAGGEYFFVHRVDLHDTLRKMCVRKDGPGQPAEILLSQKVVDWDTKGIVKLQDGTVMHADVVVAADGVHSRAHKHVLGSEVPATPAGMTNVRFVLETKAVLDDPVTAKIMDDGPGCLAFYWAPDGKSTLMRYPCHNNKLQNFGAYSLPGAGAHQIRGGQTRREDLIKLLSTQPPEIQGLAHKTEDVLYNWVVMDREPLPSYQKDRLVLVGDAAHPMATFQGQGGAQSIEDGAVLGVLLGHMEDGSCIGERLRLYDDLRIRRTSIAQLVSRVPPDEQSSNQRMPNELVELYPPNARPVYWSDAADWMWKYDCLHEATEALKRHNYANNKPSSTINMNGTGVVESAQR